MKRHLALLMFWLLAMPAFAQEPCNKVVSFGSMAATPQGARLIRYNIAGETSTAWINNWVRKDGKNNPDVCFTPNPPKGRADSLVVLSDSPRFFQGFQAVTSTTHTSPGLGRGTFAQNYGGMWNFASYSEVTTTTSHENFPYEIKTNSLYTNALNDDAALVSQRDHVNSTQTGGEPFAVVSYNVGILFKAVNTRGRLLTSTLLHLAGPAQKKAKSD